MGDILTIDELAALLKMSRNQVYSMTRARAQAGPNPLPICRINGNLRFRKQDILAWLERCAGGGK